jgi:hypothetical protein
VKASYDVGTGDIIEILFGQKSVKAEVLDVAETTKKEEAKELFRYVENSRQKSGGCPEGFFCLKYRWIMPYYVCNQRRTELKT